MSKWIDSGSILDNMDYVKQIKIVTEVKKEECMLILVTEDDDYRVIYEGTRLEVENQFSKIVNWLNTSTLEGRASSIFANY